MKCIKKPGCYYFTGFSDTWWEWMQIVAVPIREKHEKIMFSKLWFPRQMKGLVSSLKLALLPLRGTHSHSLMSVCKAGGLALIQVSCLVVCSLVAHWILNNGFRNQRHVYSPLMMSLWVMEWSMNEQESCSSWGLWGCQLPREVADEGQCSFVSHLLYMELEGWGSSPDSAAIEPCELVQITVSLTLGCLICKIMQSDSVALRPLMVLKWIQDSFLFLLLLFDIDNNNNK